jgi:flagellin-like hook-associated protein FlgL
MRISTAYPQQFNINSMFDQQAKFNETQLKISSGKKHLTPAENPTAAAYALSFKQSINETQQYQDNIGMVEQRLKLQETTITSALETIQRLQELGLQGVSDSGNSIIARNAIADEFEQLNEHLIGLANTRNANGEYIFSGTKTLQMPFGKKSDLENRLDVVTLATADMKPSPASAKPATAWTNFIKQKAITAAHDYLLQNPGSTIDNLNDAGDWAATQDLGSVIEQGKIDASLNHAAFPNSWEEAWVGTTGTFTSEFSEAFRQLTLKKMPVSALQQSADLSAVRLNATQTTYKNELANYFDPADVPQSITTQKSEAWLDYIGKQAISDAFKSVDTGYPKINLEEALKKISPNLEAYVDAVNSPAGVDGGRRGSLAFRIAANDTNSIYKTAFTQAFTQAFEAKANSVTDTPNALSGNTFVPTSTSVSEATNGGEGVIERFYTIGSGGGEFNVNYNMNNIPDRMDIYVNNQLVVTTEQPVSGRGTFTIPADKLPDGAQIKIVMTGNKPDTVWDYDVNYSGGIASSAEMTAAAASLRVDTEFDEALSGALQNTISSWSNYSAASDKVLNYTTVPDSEVTDETGTAVTNITKTGSAFVYSGSNTQREIQIGGSRKVTDGDTGISVFGPSSVTGKMLFDSVRNYAAELRADAPTLKTLQELDEAMVRLSTVRSTIGSRMNAIERQKLSNQDFIINTQTALSQVEDLDYAEAITKLNAQQLSLQAAQQSYAKVQGMSLFKFL